MHLTLESGRVWSRVRQLLNLDSSYTVTTDQVVATVRGTAFDLAKNADGTSSLLVDHSVVSGNEGMVPEGYEQTYGKGTAANAALIKATPAEWQNPWIQDNKAADRATLQRWQQADQDAFVKHHAGVFTKLAVLSAGLHGMIAKQTPVEIGEQAAVQEISLMHDLAQQGKNTEITAEIASTQNRLAQIDVRSPEAQVIIQRLWPRTQRLFEDIRPVDAGYPGKQAVEQFLLSLIDNPKTKLFQSVLETNQALDTAIEARDSKQLEREQAALKSANALIEAAMRGTNGALLDPQSAKLMQERWQAAKLRSSILQTDGATLK